MADLLGRLSKSWQHHRGAAGPVTRRLFRCERCGRPLFFRNSKCLACGAEVAYEPDQGAMRVLPDGEAPPWRLDAGGSPAHAAVNGTRETMRRYVRCAHYGSAAGCNWLVAVDPGAGAAPPQPLCRSCRLTRTLPDLGVEENAAWWARIEEAKRQVVSTLITLRLPVDARTTEDPERGLAFDLLRAPQDGPAVITGHVDGVITLDVEEADDAVRERRRSDMHEPYRTLLGHLRHEIGHYYWYRLVDKGAWLEPFRALFGDERADYPAALTAHYDAGARADWAARFVSAYASAHPWEDWAESWAHYLHMIDGLDTALSFGVSARAIESTFQRFDLGALGEAGSADPAGASTFLAFVNAWVELATALNELSRSMGQADFYPFVLSAPAVAKLHLVQRIVTAQRRSPRRRAARPGTPVALAAHTNAD